MTDRNELTKNLIAALLELAQGKAELVRHTERAWASISLSGSRHSATLSFTGAEALGAGEVFIDVLPDHKFSVPGQIVADAAVMSVERTFSPVPGIEVVTEFILIEK